ncbi:ATP-binding protein [Nitratifractor sp.]
MSVDWSRYRAAIFRPERGSIKGIGEIDRVSLEDLLGIEEQKAKIVANTEAFLRGEEAEHVLLRGSRGTGKSSLVKALLDAYADRGLRIVEFYKSDLRHLPEVLDGIRREPWRFILYLDDLTFTEGEETYTYLKSAMEGSIESPPPNLRVYATSNRRHLIPEYHDDNRGTVVAEGELHYSDAVEEKISLADRFGLWLSFYSISEAEYLRIVDHYFREQEIDRELLHREAKRFAQERASRSGRTAWQFWRSRRHRGLKV